MGENRASKGVIGRPRARVDIIEKMAFGQKLEG